jgi:Replication initiator protein A
LGRSEGMEFVLPEWLYRGVLDRRLVLAIDPACFALAGGIALWLYRVAQARRPPTRRVALRTRASPCQERELGAVLRLRAPYSDASSRVSCCRAMRLRLNAMTIAASSWSCGQAFPQELRESCGLRQSISGLRARQYRDFGWDRSEQRANVRLPSRFADPDTWTPYARNNAVNEQLEGSLIRRTAQRPASRRLGAAASGAHGDRYRRRAARPCTSAPTTVT